jgi:hypothetical protein
MFVYCWWEIALRDDRRFGFAERICRAERRCNAGAQGAWRDDPNQGVRPKAVHFLRSEVLLEDQFAMVGEALRAASGTQNPEPLLNDLQLK